MLAMTSKTVSLLFIMPSVITFKAMALCGKARRLLSIIIKIIRDLVASFECVLRPELELSIIGYSLNITNLHTYLINIIISKARRPYRTSFVVKGY
jgi:hypothetical protein